MRLLVRVFVNGLPMRGAVVEGNFFIQDTCFAGQAIVEAYKLCHALDLSGLICSPGLSARPHSVVHPSELAEFFVPYLSPLKEAKEEKLTHINWIAYLDKQNEMELLSDVETFVHRSFWAHGKDCPLSADVKIKNTVKLCRRLIMALKSST